MTICPVCGTIIDATKEELNIYNFFHKNPKNLFVGYNFCSKCKDYYLNGKGLGKSVPKKAFIKYIINHRKLLLQNFKISDKKLSMEVLREQLLYYTLSPIGKSLQEIFKHYNPEEVENILHSEKALLKAINKYYV